MSTYFLNVSNKNKNILRNNLIRQILQATFISAVELPCYAKWKQKKIDTKETSRSYDLSYFFACYILIIVNQMVPHYLDGIAN